MPDAVSRGSLTSQPPIKSSVDAAGLFGESPQFAQVEPHNSVLAILTDDQKTKYKEMIGAPFEFKLDRATPPARRPAPGVEKDKEKK